MFSTVCHLNLIQTFLSFILLNCYVEVQAYCIRTFWLLTLYTIPLKYILFLKSSSSRPYFSFQPVLHDWCSKGCGMCYLVCGMVHIKEPLLLERVASVEGNVLFNDALNSFYLRLYGVRHMVKDNSDSEKGNPLPPHRLLFPISSKGSFICTIPQTG